MMHGVCDFCGKDTDRAAYWLSITPIQNWGRYHTDQSPFGHADQTKSFVCCQECFKIMKLPNPYEHYAQTELPVEQKKTVMNYEDIDFIDDDEGSKRKERHEDEK